MGPLGNGFPLKGKKAFLIGGGIGIPPMLELAKQLNCEKQIVLGYRNCDMFLHGRVQKARRSAALPQKTVVLGQKETCWMPSVKMHWMQKLSMHVVRLLDALAR